MKLTGHHNLISDSSRRFTLDQLKCCPVCSTVNHELAFECITCRWHGEFIKDPERIQSGLSELLQRCPEFVEMLNAPTPRRRRGILKFRDFVTWLFRSRLDLKI